MRRTATLPRTTKQVPTIVGQNPPFQLLPALEAKESPKCTSSVAPPPLQVWIQHARSRRARNIEASLLCLALKLFRVSLSVSRDVVSDGRAGLGTNFGRQLTNDWPSNRSQYRPGSPRPCPRALITVPGVRGLKAGLRATGEPHSCREKPSPY